MTDKAYLYAEGRVFDSTDDEWVKFVEALSYKRILLFYGSVHGDTSRVDSHEDKWEIRSGGSLYTFDFTKYDNISFRSLMKWATYRSLSNFSVRTMCHFLGVLNYQNFDEISLNKLLDRLNYLRIKNNASNVIYFHTLKRFLGMLVDQGAPTTEIEDNYLLEQLIYPGTNCYKGYYELDVKLTPLEIQFIQDKSGHDFKYYDRLNYIELRNFVALHLSYELGLRPFQLFKLSYSSFKNIKDKYFSITRPEVKKRKSEEGMVAIDKLEISSELGLVIKELISRQAGNCTQILQNEDGTPRESRYCSDSINRTFDRWGAKGIRKSVYDFRHNLGHSLAMSGASAEEIAYMLGHKTLNVARHYISASAEIALIREKALGQNEFYGSLIAMLTGELILPEDWKGEKVCAIVGKQLITGIGGCAANECEFNPVISCYGCTNFNPFVDGNHQAVFKSLQEIVSENIDVSDRAHQTTMNPVISQLEGTMEQVKSVIKRCEICDER